MPAPSPPTNFAATPTPYGILLTWDAQAGLDGFYLYRGVASNHSDEVVYPILATFVTNGAGVSYMDLGATPATHYYYRLQASSNADGESTKVAADATAGLGMTLTAARLWARQFARNAGSSSEYSAADVDHALIVVGEQFARMTRCVRAAGTVALTASIAVADCSGLTAFRPERILDANILTKKCELEITDWQHLYKRQIECTSTGTPQLLAFETWTTANVWPTPDVNLSLRIRYWQPFTSWTPGTAGDASISFNIPDDMLAQILTYGVPAVLQHNQPEHRYASESWKKYLEFEQRMMGAGNLGAKVLIRERVR